MEIRFNLTGSERKALVMAVSAITGWEAVYQKAPTFAYVVGNFTIDKEGTLIYDERTSDEFVRALLSGLSGQGFIAGEASGTATPAEAEPTAMPDRLAIQMPMEGFGDRALDNLDKLVASKAALIRKSIGADSLPIVREGDRLSFPWFSPTSSAGEVGAYTQFVTALCNMAKTQKRVVAKEKPADSEKFALRCFLLRLGFIGEEYAAARKILLKNLSGSGSFKSGTHAHPNPAQTADSGDTGRGSGESEAYALAEALADAELIHAVNTSFGDGDCLSCAQSMSEPGEGGDRLFCVERQGYVDEGHRCSSYN